MQNSPVCSPTTGFGFIGDRCRQALVYRRAPAQLCNDGQMLARLPLDISWIDLAAGLGAALLPRGTTI